MARRYIGDAVINITYRGDYAGTISVPKEKATWKFDELYAPRVGFGPGVSHDSPKAYDIMAGSAVSFGGYYTTHNRGDDVPDWAPKPQVADAIDEATSWAQDEHGEYEVRRSPKGKAYSTRGNPSRGRKAKRATPKGRKTNPSRGRIRTGQRVQVSYGSGIASNKKGIVIDPPQGIFDHRGVPKIEGHYSPFDRKKEVFVLYDDGELGTMFKNRLTVITSNPLRGKAMKRGPARKSRSPRGLAPSRRRNSPMNKKEAYDLGREQGETAVVYGEFKPGMTMEDMESEALEGEANSRQYAGHPLYDIERESRDAPEWALEEWTDAYEDGVLVGIRKGLRERFPAKRSRKPKKVASRQGR